MFTILEHGQGGGAAILEGVGVAHGHGQLVVVVGVATLEGSS